MSLLEVKHNERNDEIRDNIELRCAAYADALATVERFNARLSAKKSACSGRTPAFTLLVEALRYRG